MESVANKKPCRTCGKNLHIGNPYECQFECKNCLKYMEFQALCEIRLAEIEDILGEEYNLEELKEMVGAEKELNYKKYIVNELKEELQAIKDWYNFSHLENENGYEKYIEGFESCIESIESM